LDLIATITESGVNLLLGAYGCGGVNKTLVYMFPAVWKKGADLPGVIADGYHIVELLVAKVFDGLRPLTTNVDSQLSHRAYSARVYAGALCACAAYFVPGIEKVTHQAFCQLRAGSVVSTDK
jgi:hypothetical protein